MTAPYRRATVASIIGNILDRLRILEAIRPDPQAAQYEFLVYDKDETVEVEDPAFWIFVPTRVNGYTLATIEAAVFTEAASGDVSLTVKNMTTDTVLGGVEIPEGDKCSTNTNLEPTNEPVATCDEIWISSTNVSDALGLEVALGFVK